MAERGEHTSVSGICVCISEPMPFTGTSSLLRVHADTLLYYVCFVLEFAYSIDFAQYFRVGMFTAWHRYWQN